MNRKKIKDKIKETKEIEKKEFDVGDGSWWNITQNLWEVYLIKFHKIKKKINSISQPHK